MEYQVLTDLILNIYHSEGIDDQVGFSSKFTEIPHPGSGNKIEGWKWDKTNWPTSYETEHQYTVPTLTDPIFFGATDSDWKSGKGSGDDIKLLSIQKLHIDDEEVWSPKVEHGYYYVYNQENYLYSEGMIGEIFSNTLDSGNFQYMDLTFIPKPTVPIKVEQYYYSVEQGKYKVYKNWNQRAEFSPLVSSGEYLESWDDTNDLILYSSVNVTTPEFIVKFDDPDNPPRITLNGDYRITNLEDALISGVSGYCEIVGESDGSGNQTYNTYYSPICSGETLKVYTYLATTSGTEWNLLEDINPSFSGVDCAIDYDLGQISFGSLNSGVIPPTGSKIAVQYTSVPAVFYEVENTPDYLYSPFADLNVLNGVSPKGFVLIKEDITYAGSIVLSADLEETSDDIYGPLYLGNIYTKLKCTVYDNRSQRLEGEEIVFEILDGGAGSFGLGEKTSESLSNFNGEAFAFYNPPTSINDIGDATNQVIHSGAINILTFENLFRPSSVDDVFLYQVARSDDVLGVLDRSDDVLGVLDTSLNTNYKTYFTDEQRTYTDLNKEIDEESKYRAAYSLPTSITYEKSDLITGAKHAVIAWDTTATHPHTGDLGAYDMVKPYYYEITDSGVALYYSGTFTDITSSGTYKSYFAVAPSEVQIRASVYNSSLRRRIYSNTITIKLDISDAQNGVYYTDTLNSIPSGLLTRVKTEIERDAFRDSLIVSGLFTDVDIEESYQKEKEPYTETRQTWFDRTRYYDTRLLGLEDVSTSGGAGHIPLGFRIRSTGLTVASALNGVVFLDVNS